MPTKPLVPCRATGCPALVSHGYCEQHRHLVCQTHRTYDHGKRRLDASLAQAAQLRTSTQWRKVRTLHKGRYPLCCDPFGEHIHLPAYNQQSHHILPLATHPHLAFDLTNLAPLCTRCHSRVEQMERSGISTQHLFFAHQQQHNQANAAFIG